MMEPTLTLPSGSTSVEYHVATALFSMVITPTLFANVLLVFIVFRDTIFRDLSTMLVAFISIADLLYVIYMCAYITMQYTLHDVGDGLCTVVITTQSVLRMVPTITFVLIACNWFLAKFKPSVCYKFHQIKNVPLKCFLATWVFAIAACIGVPFVVCNRFNKAAFLVYSTLSFICQFTVLIMQVFLHSKNLKKTFSELEPENSTKVKRAKNTLLYFNIKITGVFMFLSLIYFFLSAPLLLYPFFGNVLGANSSPFAIFLYHIISCFPCLMNPISLYFISQKFQEELRRLFGIEKTKKDPSDKASPIMPEPFSANRGFFEPRTPAWRQGGEYWNREPIYGEYPSTTPEVKEAPRKKGKKKDVRFCDIVEEVEPKHPFTEFSVSSPTVNQAPTAVDAPKSPRLTSPPICTHRSEKTNTPPPQRPSTIGCSRLVSALDLGTRTRTWPRSQSPSSYSHYQEVDLSRLGPATLLEQNRQFKRNLIKRSKSAYQPRRNEENGSAGASTETDDAWRRISKTTTRTVQVHIDVCEKEQVLETYL